MNTSKKQTRASPSRTANLFSILFFSWLDPLMKKGYRATLQNEDLFSVVERDSASYLSSKLEREWKKELSNHGKGSMPSFQRAVLKCFQSEILTVGIAVALEETSRVSQPLLLACMLDYFTPENSTSDSKVSTLHVYLYALGLTLTSMMTALMHHPFYFYNSLIGMRMRVASCALIYRKTLKLSQKALAVTTTGHVVNLMSTDASRFDYATSLIHYLWLAPVEAAVVLGILWTQLGPASLAGYALVIIFIPLQGFMGKVFARLRMKTVEETDKRVHLMDQIVAGMRVIKMYCWEKPYTELIAAVRTREMNIVKIMTGLSVVFMEFGYFTFAKLGVAACILAVVWLQGRMPSLEMVVILMRLMGTVQDSLAYYLPQAVQTWGEMATTCARIQEFLLLEEVEVSAIASSEKCLETEPAVELRAYSGKWEGGSGVATVRDVTFSAKAGELLAIVGPVGAGKSSLLMALLGELPRLAGEVMVTGRLAYVSQQPWIFSASLRQNVLFGCEYDAGKYESIIEACALNKDIEALSHGDQTLVGERGVVLSGGQKARVGLARALYQDADVYLLDDPLSAVDAAVAKHLFERCINGLLKDRPRVLVTHQLHFLRDATKVLILIDGEVKNTGSYDDLVSSGLDFPELLRPTEPSAISTIPDESMSQLNHYTPSEMDTAKTLVVKYAVCKVVPLGKGSQLQAESEITSPASQPESAEESPSEQSLEDKPEISAEEPLLNMSGTNCHARISEKGRGVLEEVDPEHMEEGAVSFATYKSLFHAGANAAVLTFLALLMATGQASFIVIDWYLTDWSYKEDRLRPATCYDVLQDQREINASSADDIQVMKSTENVTAALMPKGAWRCNLANATGFNASINTISGSDLELNVRYVHIYIALVAGVISLSILRSVVFYKVFVNASKNLHNLLFAAVVRAPLTFFDTHPVGQILNRFAMDVGIMDDQMPGNFFDFITTFMVVLGTAIMAAAVNPWVLISLVPIAAVLVIVRKVYVATSRSVKRLEAVTRSPVLSHLSTTMVGLHTVRAFKAQEAFCKEFDNHQDSHTEAWHLFLCITRWLAIRLDCMCVAFITSITFLCVIAKESSGVGANMFGLTIAYAISLTSVFQWVVSQSIEIENMMTSAERILEYSHLQPEAPLVTAVRPPLGWPAAGCLEAKHASMRYADGAPLVLKNISFSINGGEKIGICGRTGAGKSSLLTMLFRLCESSGWLAIDGVCITDIGLHDLRSKLSIIPQDPVLFSGTVRHNLDPFNQHTDPDLWEALRQVQLQTAIEVMPGGLDSTISEGGGNFSVGQRQLLCLARAILRKNKILVVDEATANVDPRTSAAIQETIRDKFAACTVLTIAHRLNTIVDSDRVMVLEDGCIREFDDPHLLLQQADSIFHTLVKHTGRKDYECLCTVARNAYKRRHHGDSP